MTATRYARTDPLPTIEGPLNLTLDAYVVEQLDAFRKMSHALRKAVLQNDGEAIAKARRYIEVAQYNLARGLDDLVRAERGEPSHVDDFVYADSDCDDQP